jgi:hypothetical protein
LVLIAHSWYITDLHIHTQEGEDDSLRRWKEQLLGDVDTTKLGGTAATTTA